MADATTDDAIFAELAIAIVTKIYHVSADQRPRLINALEDILLLDIVVHEVNLPRGKPSRGRPPLNGRRRRARKEKNGGEVQVPAAAG